jgi:hypothetical protein
MYPSEDTATLLRPKERLLAAVVVMDKLQTRLPADPERQ